MKARKKLSKSAIILILFIFIAIVAVAVLALIGKVSLVVVADAMIGLALWMSLSPYNVGIVLGVAFAAGMGVFYWLKAYIIGEEQVMIGTGIGTGYNPVPSTPSVAQQKDEVEIS